MLNKVLKLANEETLYDRSKVEQVPIRNGFGEGLVIAGDADPNVIVLCADLSESTRSSVYQKKYPNRYIEVGVAEQNMAALASGLAAVGKIPFISSYAMFSPGRNWEQIRTTICYNNRPVKIAGSHAGVSVGPDGGTHQALEDLAIARVLPRMVVISPCDAIEARKATEASAVTNTPVYLRLAREKTPVMTTNETPFEIGKAQIFWQGNKPRVGIIATGALLYQALLAAKELEEKGIAVEVMNLSTIKPLDKKAIAALANRAKAIVTVEEHQVAGGMGSAVAECLAEHKPVPMRFVGVHDQFGQSGKPEELLKHYGMDKDAIIKAVKELV